jgi:hypothetical protein
MGKAGNGYIYAGGDFQRTYPMTGVLRYNPQSENLQIYYNGWRNLSTGGGGGGETIYYSAGNGISISEENVISVNSSIVALKNEIPTKTSDLTNDSGFITSAPVTSVNGQTGAVSISVPTMTSQLTNNSDFTTKAYVDGLIGDINSVLNAINGEEV